MNKAKLVIRLPQELKDAYKEWAESQSKGMSAAMRNMIRRKIKETDNNN